MCWHQLHPQSRQEKCLSYPPGCVSGVTESLNCMAGEGPAPLRTPTNRGTPYLKIPLYSIFRAKGSQKTINVFSHFHGLIPDTNYKHLECFTMQGTTPNCAGVKCHMTVRMQATMNNYSDIYEFHRRSSIQLSKNVLQNAAEIQNSVSPLILI